MTPSDSSAADPWNVRLLPPGSGTATFVESSCEKDIHEKDPQFMATMEALFSIAGRRLDSERAELSQHFEESARR